MTSDSAASAIPTHSGSQPKASCMALQMVLLWMELYERPKVMVSSTANSADSQRECTEAVGGLDRHERGLRRSRFKAEGLGEAEAVAGMFPGRSIAIIKDLNGIDRIVRIDF